MSKSITEPFTTSVIPGSKLCNAKWSPVLSLRSYGVMVSTLDFESSDPSSNLGRTSIQSPFCSTCMCIVFNTAIMETQNPLETRQRTVIQIQESVPLILQHIISLCSKGATYVMYFRKSSPHFTSTSAMMIPSGKSTFSATTSRTRTQLPPLHAQILCL